MTTVVFSHGQESGPWGTKIRAMAELAKGLGCAVESIDYQGIADPTARVEKLVAECGLVDDTLILERDYALSGFAAVASAHGDLLGEPDSVAQFMIEGTIG